MIRKADVLAALRARVEADLVAVTASQRDAQAGATHEEAKPEHDKDTRATEASYLARGLAERVAQLGAAASALANMVVKSFADQDPIAVSALVTVEDADGVDKLYFIAPSGGGLKVTVGGVEVSAVTTESPMGRGLVGKHADDELELRTPDGVRSLTIVAVR